jgi:hypothetical protein
MVKNTPDIMQLPRPAAVTIGSPLSEVLRFKTHNLKQQLPFLIAIVILGNKAPSSIRILEQISRVNPERGQDLICGASSMAVQ